MAPPFSVSIRNHGSMIDDFKALRRCHTVFFHGSCVVLKPAIRYAGWRLLNSFLHFLTLVQIAVRYFIDSIISMNKFYSMTSSSVFAMSLLTFSFS